MQNPGIFFAILFIIVWASDWILTKKYNIKKEEFFYTFVNESHKWGAAFILAISLVLLLIHTFVLEITGPFKPHHLVLAILPFSIFNMFMEYRYERDSKRYLRSMLQTIFFLIFIVGFVFYNPAPVRLEVDQVKEITIESYSETEEVHTITLTDEDLIKPILNTIGEGGYQRGTYPIEPRLEMTIKHGSGREILIKESIHRNGVFMIYTDRFLIPRDMTLFSQDLQHIFEDIADTLVKKE